MWRRSIRRIIRWSTALFLIPAVLIIDIAVAVIETITPISRPLSLWLGLLFTAATFVAVTRALAYGPGPAAAAAAAASASMVNVTNDASVLNEVYADQIMLHFELLSALSAIIRSAIMFVCATGVLVSTVVMHVAIYPISICVFVACANILASVA